VSHASRPFPVADIDIGESRWPSVRSTAARSTNGSNPSSEEEAEALLAEFPGNDLEELATKEFVRAEISDLRTEMHQLFNRMFVGLTGVMIGIAGVAIAIARG
jgi:hypothetical protein